MASARAIEAGLISWLLVACWCQTLTAEESGIQWRWKAASSVVDRQQPQCVDLPSNLNLCLDMPYKRMMLPNLLGHDSVDQVLQQALTWMPLLNVRCHPELKVFLCSLYAPVCVPGASIRPCRSLCGRVQSGCEPTMNKYGFSWPDIVNCTTFPQDNNMCILPQANGSQTTTEKAIESCGICNKHETKENILDHYCRSDVAVRVRFNRITRSVLVGGKARVLKSSAATQKDRRSLRRPRFRWSRPDGCCRRLRTRSRRYLVLARREHDRTLVPTFIMPWKKNKVSRDVRRLLNKLDCSDPDSVQNALLPGTTGRQLRSFRPRARPRFRLYGRHNGTRFRTPLGPHRRHFRQPHGANTTNQRKAHRDNGKRKKPSLT